MRTRRVSCRESPPLLEAMKISSSACIITLENMDGKCHGRLSKISAREGGLAVTSSCSRYSKVAKSSARKPGRPGFVSQFCNVLQTV